MELKYLKNIKKGMKVEIFTLKNKIEVGIVEELLTTPDNPKGLIVKLKNGEIGRIQRILSEYKKETEIDTIIFNGENFFTEFKLGAMWSQDYTEQQIKESKSVELHNYARKASRIIIAKSIASFLNSEGGMVLLGIKEKKDSDSKENYEVIGIDDEIKKLKDPTKDGYRRMIIDEIIRSYFPPRIYNHLNQYIWINLIDCVIGEENCNKTVCAIKVRRSETKVFLKIYDKEVFMIRTDTENRELTGEKLVDYCMKHFKS